MELNEARMRDSAQGAAAAGGDHASQLERLEAMRDRGTLTEEEFQAHKQKLLDT